MLYQPPKRRARIQTVGAHSFHIVLQKRKVMRTGVLIFSIRHFGISIHMSGINMTNQIVLYNQ